MENVLFRFLIVWASLHIILFFVEWYRYKHSDWSWYDFKRNGMLGITYGVLFTDIVGVNITIILGLGYWIFEPIIH